MEWARWRPLQLFTWKWSRAGCPIEESLSAGRLEVVPLMRFPRVSPGWDNLEVVPW
jgi:hypothetical protein